MIEAVSLAKRLAGKREAYRRHMNYIGKLMRTEDIEAIEQAMEKIKNRHFYTQQHQHQLERIAVELIKSEQSDDKIQQLLEEYPSLDRQKLRQQVRTAKRQTQQSTERPISQVAKELQRYLGEHIHRS
jgi:ribosome-associated protein